MMSSCSSAMLPFFDTNNSLAVHRHNPEDNQENNNHEEYTNQCGEVNQSIARLRSKVSTSISSQLVQVTRAEVRGEARGT